VGVAAGTTPNSSADRRKQESEFKNWRREEPESSTLGSDLERNEDIKLRDGEMIACPTRMERLVAPMGAL
jgi:hypothetical protein